jgi:serine/threonine protein kinase
LAGGRYILENALGQGGMATVFLAHDTVLDRRVALKILNGELGADPSFQERFRREAQVVARLNHPNVVTVYDSGRDLVAGTWVPYIVMEYVEGDSLRTVLDAEIANNAALPIDRALHITADVLTGLAESHALGLVHRDIKPANIMITRRGVVKVMDFGIARPTREQNTSMTQAGVIVGTPQYLSPEQAMAKPVDERSDLYSVGVVLFEMLTGRVPFTGDTTLEIALQHVRDAPPPLSVFLPAVPPQVEHLVARALSKDPQQRPASTRAMLEEISHVRASLSAPTWGGQPAPRGVFPVSAHDQTSPLTAPGAFPAAAQPQRPVRRWRPAFSVAVAGLVLAAAAAGLLQLRDGQPQSSASASPTTTSTTEDTPDAPDTSAPPATASAQVGDDALIMPVSECTNPWKWPDGKVSVPYFKLHHIDSVRECAEAGGWQLIEKKTNETLWGEGVVVAQDPFSTQIEPADKTVTVWVSTGLPAS